MAPYDNLLYRMGGARVVTVAMARLHGRTFLNVLSSTHLPAIETPRGQNGHKSGGCRDTPQILRSCRAALEPEPTPSYSRRCSTSAGQAAISPCLRCGMGLQT